MNQNRCCPGVPNKYKIKPASSVTRPKSIATVVVVLSGVCDRSSSPSDAAVITASVVNGVISDTDPTNVVFPTPNPPATTIFTDVIAASAATPETALELAKSTEHPLQQIQVRATLRMIQLMNPHQPLHRHISNQNPRHPQRHPQHRRNLRHRPPVPAKPQNRLTLRAQHRQIPRLIMRRRHHRLNLQLSPRPRPPPRHRIRPDQRTPSPIPRRPQPRITHPRALRRPAAQTPRTPAHRSLKP